MQGTMKKFLLGASVVAGISGIAGAPAFAGSLTGASVSGVAGTDYYVYKQVGNQTVRDDSAALSTVLQGSCAVVAGACNPAGSPGGNVELAANSEKAGFDFTKNTTLSGTIGGKSITLSSLTDSDWNTMIGGQTLLDKYLTDALNANGFASIVSNSLLYNQAKINFTSNGGKQRFSDPNISYVNQDDSTGKISIGLAGHLDATDLLLAGMTPAQKTLFLSQRAANKVGTAVQASEIVKVTYNGQASQYLYSFTAANSGLTAADDGRSHNGEYEVTLQGDPVPVPEPSALLGLMTVGGLFVAKRKLNKR